MSNFDEIVEKFLRPKALAENFDHSTWSDERAVWILSEALGLPAGEDDPVFVPANLISTPSTADTAQVKLANGKVPGQKEWQFFSNERLIRQLKSKRTPCLWPTLLVTIDSKTWPRWVN